MYISGLRNVSRLGIIQINEKDLDRPLNLIICTQGNLQNIGYRKSFKHRKEWTHEPEELVNYDTWRPCFIAIMNHDVYFWMFLGD